MLLPFDYPRFKKCLDFLFDEVNLLPILSQYYDDSLVEIFIKLKNRDYSSRTYYLRFNNNFLLAFRSVTNWGEEVTPTDKLIGNHYLVRTLKFFISSPYLLVKILNFRGTNITMEYYDFKHNRFIKGQKLTADNINILSIPPLMLDKIMFNLNG